MFTQLFSSQNYRMSSAYNTQSHLFFMLEFSPYISQSLALLIIKRHFCCLYWQHFEEMKLIAFQLLYCPSYLIKD